VAAGGPASPALEAHLAACEACRLELDELRRALAIADAELGSLLSAAPSAELAARIRTALSEAPVAASWRPFWLPFAAVAAALLLALGVFALRDRQSSSTGVALSAQRAADAVERPTTTGERTPPAVEPAAPVLEPPAAVASASSATPAIRPAPVRPTASSARPGTSRAPAVEPEVLVPAGEAEALLRFAATVQRRSVTPASLLVADLNAPLAESSDLAIRPIELVPLGPEEDSGAE
jgi:hypothetical protein